MGVLVLEHRTEQRGPAKHGHVAGVLLAVLGACSAPPPSSPGVANVKPRAPERVTAPPPPPRIAGSWSDVRDTRGELAGLVATSEGPVLYLGAVGGGRVSLGRLREGTWQFEELATGTYTTKGHIAASGARVGATFLDVDPFAMRISVRYIEPGGGVETIAEGCGPKPHALAIGARGPIIALACHDRLQLFERTTAGRREAYDERPDQHPWIRRLAVDGSGDRHLLVSYRMVAHHISIRDGVKRAHELPENMELADLAVCGGRVHGSFYRRSLDEPVIAFGTFADGRWMLEEVERGEGGSWDLGFDDACRPFLAGGTIVWSRGNGEWTSSEVTRRHADIKAVVGIDGVLYAAYEYEDDNGVRVGIATAPLVDPTAAPSE